MSKKKYRQKSNQRGSFGIISQKIKKNVIEAITDEEIEVYVDPFPFKLLTEDEKQEARKEIYIWKSGGFVLDGLATRLTLDSRNFQRKR